LALLSFGLWTGHAAASVPPVETPPASDDTTPPAAEERPELVQSWTLTPGGSAGNEAGSRPNLSYQIAPGTVIEDTVIVYNLGNTAMDFRIYATDAFNNDDGEFDLLAGDAVPVDVGSWVTLAQEGIVLPPGKQATIPITISVPVDATPGDHVGAIVASNVAVSDNGDGQIVNVDRRTGTRMYIQVEGPLIRELAVTDLHTTYHHALSPFGGKADVTFRVENRGNVRLGGSPSVSIAGPLGLGKKTITLPPLTELLPGQDVALTATIDGAPALVLDSTTVRIAPVEPEDVGGVQPAIGKDRTFAPPISVLLILLAFLLAVLARRQYRRHRNAVGTAMEPEPTITQQPERQPQHQ
jgi:hypothetical protein